MKIQHTFSWLVLLLMTCGAPWHAMAATPAHGEASAPAVKVSAVTKTRTGSAATPADADKSPPLIDLKKSIREQLLGSKKMTLVISDKPAHTASDHAAPASDAAKAVAKNPGHLAETNATKPAVVPAVAHPAAAAVKQRNTSPTVVINPRASRDYIRAKAAALTGQATASAGHDNSSHDSPDPAHGSAQHGTAHWSYMGETGPQAWGQLQPEFGTCATGQRQSPINIEDSYTLQGPAEPLRFNYSPSNGTVINNGHTIQVEMQGSNSLAVRGAAYSLLQIHFHSPSEEQVNFRQFAMVAHLVHQNAQGQLAVVAVLFDTGEANPVIDKIWTYMPLDVNDRVSMPAGLLNLKELLPQDQRYYQFFGSLTTPPCTEGVLWMVLKQTVQISQAQLRLFQQLYPNNARPVQPVNNRPVRNAQ